MAPINCFYAIGDVVHIARCTMSTWRLLCWDDGDIPLGEYGPEPIHPGPPTCAACVGRAPRDLYDMLLEPSRA